MPASTGESSNFSPRAQQALKLSREEASRFNHNFVGTEHVLLGLIALGQGTAVAVLRKMGLDLESVRLEVEKQVGTGPDQKVLGSIPYTPRVKRVLALAAKEAKALNHTHVGTEHILLGLLCEGDGVAARILRQLGVNTEKTRQEILRELDPNYVPKAVDTEPNKMQPKAEPPIVQRDPIDITKRYDVYCTENIDLVMVYRNAIFKGTKELLQKGRRDVLAEFLEIEQSDGQTVYVPRYSLIKFCEHGVKPNSEIFP